MRRTKEAAFSAHVQLGAVPAGNLIGGFAAGVDKVQMPSLSEITTSVQRRQVPQRYPISTESGIRVGSEQLIGSWVKRLTFWQCTLSSTEPAVQKDARRTEDCTQVSAHFCGCITFRKGVLPILLHAMITESIQKRVPFFFRIISSSVTARRDRRQN